eukprot:1166190-Amorphochlora_amoeboformis.AAC.1
MDVREYRNRIPNGHIPDGWMLALMLTLGVSDGTARGLDPNIHERSRKDTMVFKFGPSHIGALGGSGGRR